MKTEITPEQQVAYYMLLKTNKADLIKALRHSGQGLPTCYNEYKKVELVDWIKRWVDPVKVFSSVEQLRQNKGE
jgi:hypothetical protein